MRFSKTGTAIVVGLLLLAALGAALLTKQLKTTTADSSDATLASELREQLGIWYMRNREYPMSLEQIWNQEAIRAYRTKYNVSDDKKIMFSYISRTNSYELTFTNFGVVQIQIGSNGVIVR